MSSLLITYHPDFSRLGYPPLKERVAPAFAHLEERGLLARPGVEVLEPGPIDISLLRRVHTERHIEDVMVSGYGEVALLSAGGVVEASELVAEGEKAAAFCFVGAAGHHASREGYWGFCFLNDVAAATMNLLDGGLCERIAILDIDPHYGDGTRDILGPEKDVLHLNFHSNFGSRSTAGGANNRDIPLPYDAKNDLFLGRVEEALELATGFFADLFFVIFGHDSHRNDYGAFHLSDSVFGEFARLVEGSFPERICYVLSGGSDPEVAKVAIGSVVETLI